MSGPPDSMQDQLERALLDRAMDEKFGYDILIDQTATEPRLGWLVNMHSTVIESENLHPEKGNVVKSVKAAVEYYFIEEDGSRFKTVIAYEPYFYISVKEEKSIEVEQYLQQKYDISSIKAEEKEDLDLKNHLIGLRKVYLKLAFENVTKLLKVRRTLAAVVKANKERAKRVNNNSVFAVNNSGLSYQNNFHKKQSQDCLEFIDDIREYDVPYHIRVAIDKNIFCGVWYDVKIGLDNSATLTRRDDKVVRPDPVVLAFDIECTKLPLKFPDSSFDNITMISYMIDKQGFLIVNRAIVAEDIEDFEYTPKPEFEGIFTIFNEQNEEQLLRRFFEHIQSVKPTIIVTFNGDSFDWPFVEARAKCYNINMAEEIGFAQDNQKEYKSRHCIHMDAFRWVKRDSYLPVGSQGLKAVTKAKLGYNPLELDPEEMTPLCGTNPQALASYSVSDAVATYYLYMKYVHPFVFALCTIIPMEPDEVLRKGSGTLCETLLMVQAYNASIIMPNKQQTAHNRLFKGHLLETETYVGGHVEAIESGVFRSDLPIKFRIEPDAINTLIDKVERTMKYALETEGGVKMEEVTNFDEVCQQIKDKLKPLAEQPNRNEKPMIYHLDVGAMYPNIILTNRLQPSAIADEVTCAACDFNKPGATCQRKMGWTWRGEHLPATRDEYEMIKLQLESERFPNPYANSNSFNSKGASEEELVAYHELPMDKQAELLKKRLKAYSQRVYKKGKVTVVQDRQTTFCMRENPFYVDTVRAFRDRRYEYKGELKKWKKKTDESIATQDDPLTIQHNKNMVVLYDSLQLAHKCILNSFYGYVMRRGARWYSMEMAGVVCNTGANIIMEARELVEKIGRPLELDTDGIWCVLPCSFPEDYHFQTNNPNPKKAKVTISYPGAMLNIGVSDNHTNHQYQNLVDPETLQYSQHSENSIFFEVDGPYKAMILPASKEEDKKLKKRYAVFNPDGSLAELKGFEIKRRGELKIIKLFQGQVFDAFLKGKTLAECYASVAEVANHWLDVLYSKANGLEDAELFDLISENRNMSRTLEDYGAQKSTSISTAKRLAEFLGDQVIKDKGLNCQFIISKKPLYSPVTERAVPVAIFFAEPAVREMHLKRWLKSPTVHELDIRSVLDWDYYIERLGSAIQKIVTIPAAMQNISNPVPRVRHPDWLFKRVAEKNDSFKQMRIDNMFKRIQKPAPPSQKAIQMLGEGEGDTVLFDNNNDDDTPFGGDDDIGDIEDIVSLQIGGSIPNGQGTRKRDREESASPPKRTLGTLGEAPDRTQDYKGWLAHQKQKWKLQREERKKRRTEGLGVRRTEERGTLGSFLNEQARAIAVYPWHIIQLDKTKSPGVYKLWALVNGRLHNFRVEVPRVFYVNCRATDEMNLYPKVSRSLPRSRPSFNLHQISMSERHFLENRKELSTIFTDPNVDGVYETKIDLLDEAIMQLGSVCSLQNKSLANSTSFGISDLTGCVPHVKYLDPETCRLRKIFLYYSFSDTRGIIGVCFTASTDSHIIVIDPFGNNEMPNLIRMFRDERRKLIDHPVVDMEDYTSALPPDDQEFTVHFVNSVAAGVQKANKLVMDYKSEGRGPTLLAINTLLKAHRLRELFSCVEEFPYVEFPLEKDHCTYPALLWQRYASEHLITRYLQYGFGLRHKFEHAQYAQMPLCNIPLDYAGPTIDLLFARQLRKHHHLLWSSPTGRPDLGGKENDDNELATQLEELPHVEENNPGSYSTYCVELVVSTLAVNTILQSRAIAEAAGNAAESGSFEFNQLRTVQDSCKDENDSGGTSGTAFNDTAACGEAFLLLRSMLTAWVYDVHESQNVQTDFLLQRVYSWLTSYTNSKLHDPALFKHVFTLMTRVFVFLTAEFRRLGAEVIFANFHRIVICTKKKTLEDAQSYTDYILAAIGKNVLFNVIDIVPFRYWENIMWMDNKNFGGMVALSTASLQNDGGFETEVEEVNANMEGEEVQPQREEFLEDEEVLANAQNPHHCSEMDDGCDWLGEDKENLFEENYSVGNIMPVGDGIGNGLLEKDQMEIRRDTEICDSDMEMMWNIKSYLPKLLQEYFNTIIGKYVLRIRDYQKYKLKESIAKQNGLKSTSDTQNDGEQVMPSHSFVPNPEFDRFPTEEKYIKHIFKDAFTQDLFKYVQDIKHKLSGDAASDDKQSEDFPVLPGSYLSMNNPALEYIKFVTKIFDLVPMASNEVKLLRRNLLKMVGVREFSKEAQFLNPCRTFILSEVICNHCNYVCDMDLCRDTNIVDQNGEWLCEDCGESYNKVELESRLIDIVERLSMSYQLQDLLCEKCGEVKCDHISRHCRCSHNYVTRRVRDDFLNKLKTLLTIAEYHKLSLLLGTVRWMLSSNPATIY
eukprot:Nk52_evm25s226 gene=Nk52_evmTU25s226